MNGWQQETAAQQAKQSNKRQVSVATVYLLTGPMLLGTPAREKQRERRFNGGVRVRPQVAGVASACEDVWTGHVACAVLRRRSEVSLCFPSFISVMGHPLTRQERSLLPRKRPHTTNAFPKSPRDAFQLVCDADKEAVEGHRRRGGHVSPCSHLRVPTSFPFLLPDSR